jgi:hypothetical protein
MFIGRLPVNSAAETTAAVNKILAYEQTSVQDNWNSKVLFIADNADSGGNFPVLSDQIANNYLPPSYSGDKMYYKITHNTVADARAAILAAINQGRLIVNYTGHAGVQYWASEQFLHVNSLPSLTNLGKYPFFLPMTCQEGYFIHPTAAGYNYPSLAESLVRAADKGAIASFSPAGFGLASGHDFLAQGLYIAVFKNFITRIGDATNLSKLYLYANSTGYNDLIDTYALLGDPFTGLKTIQNLFYLPVVWK